MAQKKVCGITVIHTPNYGTVLQTFALQKAVNSLGHDYSVLNYNNIEQELKFTFWGHTEYMDWKYRIAKKLLYPWRKKEIKTILSFCSNIRFTPKIKSKKELDLIGEKYDAFITGSDQVWNNQEINHFDDSYFLSFARNRKIAYAASFGKTYAMLTDEDKRFYRENLPNLDRISVREKSGKEIVRKISGQDAVWVCDPVLLVGRKEWEKYCVCPRENKYIFVYFIGNGINFDINRKIIRIAEKIGKENGLKVVVASIGLSSLLYKDCIVPSVNKWLGYIKHAELVLTNSFHGTIFSLIFERTFYSFVKGDESSKMNTRIYDMLLRIGLEDRIIDVTNCPPISMERLDHEKARRNMEQFIKQSKDFLQYAIEND